MAPITNCRAMAQMLGPFNDGQLDAAATVEIEEHLGPCETCRERLALMRATQNSLRKVVKRETPVDFRTRALAAISAERIREAAVAARSREADTRARESKGLSLLSFRTLLPLTAAAAVVLAWNARAGAPSTVNKESLADIVAEHAVPLPPDTQPNNVRALDRFVGVPVNALPMRARERNARLVGARVLPMNHERGAMLQYELESAPNGQVAIANGQPGAQPSPQPSTQRVSVFIYDPRKIQVDDASLAPRAVGTSQVRVGRSNGYSVAMTEHDGVGYVVASDLDPDMNAQLIGDFTP